MLGSEFFIGCIDHLKALRHSRRLQSLNRPDKKSIQLDDILYELDFGYDIINGEFKLLDFFRTNRCNVEHVRLRIDKNLTTAVLDILNDSLNDYILIPMVKDLIFSMGVKPRCLYRAKDVLKYMREYSYKFTDKQLLMVEAIIDPTKIRIDNIIRNMKRSN